MTLSWMQISGIWVILPLWKKKLEWCLTGPINLSFIQAVHPDPTSLERKDLHHHQMLNTHDHKHFHSGTCNGTHTLAHTLSHRTRKKGVDMNTFASKDGGFVVSPSLTSCSGLPHRRRKYGVMSPLAWPRCLKTFHAPPKRMRGRHYSE